MVIILITINESREKCIYLFFKRVSMFPSFNKLYFFLLKIIALIKHKVC